MVSSCCGPCCWVQVRCPAAQRRELSDLAEIFHGTVCDVSLSTITLEIQGKEDKMHALQGLLEPYGALTRTACPVTADMQSAGSKPWMQSTVHTQQRMWWGSWLDPLC